MKINSSNLSGLTQEEIQEKVSSFAHLGVIYTHVCTAQGEFPELAGTVEAVKSVKNGFVVNDKYILNERPKFEVKDHILGFDKDGCPVYFVNSAE